MTDIKMVKEESIDEFEDALKTLASAAIEHDSLPLLASAAVEHDSLHLSKQLQNEVVLDSWQQKEVPKSTQEKLPQIVKPEPKLMDTCVPNSSPFQSRLTDTSVLSPQWFDVGIVRKPSCTVSNFYFTKTSIDHCADSSDNLPDYTGLHKLPLLPGVAYKFRVAAINSCGVGEWSDVTAFKTCSPGYPGAPCLIRISRLSDGVSLRWEPPLLRYGRIVEYTVCLAVKNQIFGDNNANYMPFRELPFVRVYCGPENYAFVENNSLKAARIERSTTNPVIIFRIAARNEKGYGPATQVRWLQDFDGARSDENEAKKSLYS